MKNWDYVFIPGAKLSTKRTKYPSNYAVYVLKEAILHRARAKKCLFCTRFNTSFHEVAMIKGQLK